MVKELYVLHVRQIGCFSIISAMIIVLLVIMKKIMLVKVISRRILSFMVIVCPVGCATCTDDKTCQTCDDDAVFFENTCPYTCPEGMYNATGFCQSKNNLDKIFNLFRLYYGMQNL